MTDHSKDMRQGQEGQRPDPRREDGLANQSDARNRANQDAASRPGVDAEHGLDDRGHMVAHPHEGSTYQPLRAGSVEDRVLREKDARVLDQGAGRDDGEGVSRRGAATQHGDAIRESQSAPGGGSVFQPLEADPRHREDAGDKQRRNPAGQNQQGLNENGPGEQIRERRPDERQPEDRDPRGMPGGTGRG